MSAVIPFFPESTGPLPRLEDFSGATRIPLCLSGACVAELASRAAVLEAAVSPKPGLVCIDGNGAHRDMNYPLFVRSAHALRPYFAAAHAWGETSRGMTPQRAFTRLRGLGVAAERRMLAATNGVNTHKGLIFSMGLFCAAVGRMGGQNASIDDIRRTASAFVRGLVEKDFAPLLPFAARQAEKGAALEYDRPKAARSVLEARLGRGLSAGEVVFLLYGTTGIRGEAENGFPHVGAACAALGRHGAGRDLNTAMAHCLLELVRDMDDTTLLWRGGRRGRAYAAMAARVVLAAGGLRTPEGAAALRRMSADFAAKGLSPGGCADILAVSVFLLLLQRHATR